MTARNRLCIVAWIFAIALVFALPTGLVAQNVGNVRRAQQQAAVQPVEIHGTIQGLSRTGVKVLAQNNQVMLVSFTPRTKIVVTGTTTAAALRSGVFVEFDADLDASGQVQGKIDKLTVISLSPQRQPGAVRGGEAKAAAKPGDAKPDDFGAGAGQEGKPAKRAARPAAKSPSRSQPAGNYHVIGRLVVGRDNKMSVQTGRSSLMFELADGASVNVSASDLSYAGLGSEVSIKAVMSPTRPVTIQAVEVVAKVSAPEAGGKNEPPAASEEKRPRRGAKKKGDE